MSEYNQTYDHHQLCVTQAAMGAGQLHVGKISLTHARRHTTSGAKNNNTCNCFPISRILPAQSHRQL